MRFIDSPFGRYSVMTDRDLPAAEVRAADVVLSAAEQSAGVGTGLGAPELMARDLEEEAREHPGSLEHDSDGGATGLARVATRKDND